MFYEKWSPSGIGNGTGVDCQRDAEPTTLPDAMRFFVNKRSPERIRAASPPFLSFVRWHRDVPPNLKEMMVAEDELAMNPIELATELTVAWLNNPNNRVTAEDAPAFLQQMHATILELSNPAQVDEPSQSTPEFTPAVSARKSLASKDHIISMIDGKPYKTLRRHLSTHGLSPEQYRERYNLKPDYPMESPIYSESRRAMANKIGLGRKPGMRKETSAPPASQPKRGRAAPKTS